jgi:hypothetical protein
MHGVFVSYARSDSEFVLKVAKALRDEGRRIWVDQLDIPKGGRWDDEVEKALKASSCLLVVLSPASTQSQNVLDEVSFALDEKKVVLPILLQSGSIPFRLKRLQYIDFTGDYDDAYRQLALALDALSPPRPAASAEEPAQAAPVAPSKPSVDSRQPAREPVTAAPTRPATASGAGAATPRRFPQGIVYLLTALGVLAIGYTLFTTMKLPADVAAPAPVSAPVAQVEPPAQTPAPPVVKAPPPAEPPKPTEPPAAALIADAQVEEFVGRYLAAQNSTNVAELLRFYADRVDYFDQKGVGKDFILKDKQNFYRRWPTVDNRLTSPVVVDRTPGDGSVQVSYTIKYRVSNPGRAESKAGTARDELQLRRQNGDLLIVAQRQKVMNAAN